MLVYATLTLVSVLIIAFAGEIADFFHGIKIPWFNKPYVKHLTLLTFLSFLSLYLSKMISFWLVGVSHLYQATLNFFISLIGEGRFAIQLIEIMVYLLLSIIPWLFFYLIYWFCKKESFPYFYTCIWVTWVVVILSVQIA